MDSSCKSSWYTFFFKLSHFLELCPFEKIRMKSGACHILWIMHARVLKFHIWIPHGKIADHFFFLVQVISSFWSYAPLKKSEWNLVSKISRKVFELETWSADRGCWVDYLFIYFFLNSPYFSGVMALRKFGHFKLVSKISQKVLERGTWNLINW